MHPTLFTLRLLGHELPLRSYGALILLGIVLGLALLLRDARRSGLLTRGPAIDLAFWAVLGGVLGARLLYLAGEADRYLLACLDPARYNTVYLPEQPLAGPRCWMALELWEGGLVWYGGVLGALVATWIFTRARQIPLPAALDLLTPAAVLGHAVGRIGCFFAGCCWGSPCSLPWAVRLPAGSMAWNQQVEQGLIPLWAEASLPLHPAQLYEAGGELLILCVLLLRRARGRPWPGQLIATWALLYALLRSLVELARGDDERSALLRWGISLLVMAFAVALLAWKGRSSNLRGPDSRT